MKKIIGWFKDQYYKFKLRQKIKEMKKKDPFIYKQMTEFRLGIIELLRRIIGGSSLGLAVVYTLGHIIIAMASVRLITGATLELAALDAIIEPIINGVWFYILHRAWKHFKGIE